MKVEEQPSRLPSQEQSEARRRTAPTLALAIVLFILRGIPSSSQLELPT